MGRTYSASVGKVRNACKIVVRRPERRRLLGSHWCIQEDNVKMDLREIGCEDLDSTGL
jgi:hypothetical protein